MKVRFCPFHSPLAALAVALLALPLTNHLHAQETAGNAVIRNQRRIANLTIEQGTARSVIPLRRYFGIDGVTEQVVRFNTILGNMDVQLRPNVAPKNVANFLSYVNSGAYTNSFFHRSVPNSVIQGGGYSIKSDNAGISDIPANAPVVNEYNEPNIRGTISAAKPADSADGATNQWFFNTVDNSTAFDSTNNGGYTVFGQVIGNGFTVLDVIAAVPVPATGSAPPFDTLPLIDYVAGTAPTPNELVRINSVATIPVLANQVGQPSLIRLTATSSNPALAVASIVGNKLHLVYDTTQTGSSRIVVRAQGARGRKVKRSFTVTVVAPPVN